MNSICNSCEVYLAPTTLVFVQSVSHFWCFVFSGAVCDSLPNSSQCAQTRWPRLVPPLNLTMECLAAHSRPPRRSQRYSPRFGQESALMVRVNNQIYTFWRITPPSSFFQQENRTFLFWPPLYGQPHRKKYFWQLPYSSYSAWTNSNRSVAVATDNNVCVKSRKRKKENIGICAMI